VLFWNGDVRVIDFDDSGFGYCIFDLSVILEDSEDDQIQPQFRDALLDGYARMRPLSEDQIGNIDLFLASFAVYWSLFAVDAVRYHPEDRKEILERMSRYFKLVENHLSRNCRHVLTWPPAQHALAPDAAPLRPARAAEPCRWVAKRQ
jgi:Ser/Thr protein kinase RdoA (MazF antagonist)